MILILAIESLLEIWSISALDFSLENRDGICMRLEGDKSSQREVRIEASVFAADRYYLQTSEKLEDIAALRKSVETLLFGAACRGETIISSAFLFFCLLVD